MIDAPKLKVIGFGTVVLTVQGLAAACANYSLLFGRTSTSEPTVPGPARFDLDNITVLFEDPNSETPNGEGIRSFNLQTIQQGTFGVDTLAPASLNATSSTDLVTATAPRTPTSPLTQDSITIPGAVHAIDHLVIRSANVDATRAFYEESLGLRVLFDREFADWNVRLCMLRVGDAVLEIAGSLEGSKSTGSELRESERNDSERSRTDAENRDHLWGITWRVDDVDTARTRLTASGFDVSVVREGRRPSTRVATLRDRTHGVATLLIEHN